MQHLISNIYIYMFYRLIQDVMQLKKTQYIKNKPNQSKSVKITKSKNSNDHTHIYIYIYI